MAIPTYEGKYILYTSRIKSGMNGSPLLEATEVADLAQNKLQSEVNAETLTALGDRYTKAEADKKISDAVAAIYIPEFSLPTASPSVLGGIKIGSSPETDGYFLQPDGKLVMVAANTDSYGFVRIAYNEGDKDTIGYLTVDADGTIYLGPAAAGSETTAAYAGAMSASDKAKLDSYPGTWTAAKDEIKGYVDSQTDGIAALEARIAALEAALTLK